MPITPISVDGSDSEVSEDRVSVIKWACKRGISSEPADSDLTQEESMDESSIDDRETKSPDAETTHASSNDENSFGGEQTTGSVSDSDSDVEFIGEFPPSKTSTTANSCSKDKQLPSFFQFAPWGSYCPNNSYIQYNPYMQNALAFGLPSQTQNWLKTQCNKYTNQLPYGCNYPLSLVTVALRARAQMLKPKHFLHSRPKRILPTPVEKPYEDFQSLMEASESEYVETKVYHLDRAEGILKYKCKTCDTFIRKKTISKIRPIYGNKNPSNKCRICSKTFFTCKQLQSHLFRHSEKKLCCSYCSKKFLTKSEINNHINTHTGQKPFQCPACPASFAQSSRYYTHIRDLHKRYHCDDCFRRNYNNNGKEN